MKRFVKAFSVILFSLIAAIDLSAQNISIKEVKELGMDITASKYERLDNAGKSCAVVKVALPSSGNISFTPSVGETLYNSGQYIVYVSDGTSSLTVMRNNSAIYTIDFEKYGLQITSKHTYMVTFDVEQIREAIFHIQPSHATLKINDETVALDNDGTAKFACKPDIMYNYIIEAENYETVEDGFMLDPEEGYIEPINIILESKMGNVTFTGNVDEVELIVNNESYGMIQSGNSIQLPFGSNDVKIVAEKYEDWTQKVYVSEETSKVHFIMQKANDVSKKLRSRTSFYVGSGFIFDFNSDMNMDKENMNGYPLRFGVDIEKFITRWFTFRYGIEGLFFMGDKFKINDEYPFSVNVPLIFSLNAPLGKFNRNHFSVGLGPVLGYVFLEEDSSTDGNEDFDILGGGRLEARFTFNHFILSAGLEYQYFIKQNLSEKGFLVPSLTLGYKF